MKEFLQGFTDALGPVASSALGHALIGLLILIVGLFVVKLITGIATRGLKKVNFLHRTEADGSETSFVKPIATLLKAILTIMVLMAVLQHFGLTDVLAPLREMVQEFMSAVPNVIGAGVIAYAGWIIAKIVADLVGMALTKVDEQVAERTGNSDIKVSGFGRALVFALIVLPIAVSALGVLNIPAISDPASAMIEKLMAALPNIVGAAIIILVTYLVAKFVVYVLSALLEGMNVDALPAKLGVKGVFTESFTLTRFIGMAIMFFALLAASTAAVNLLGIDIISQIFANVLEFGGGLLVGGLILVIGNFLATIAHKALIDGGHDGIANIARFAILGLVLAMGLRAMGLADNIVNMAFGATIGSVAVAAALAFGLGGRDAAKTVADAWARKATKG